MWYVCLLPFVLSSILEKSAKEKVFMCNIMKFHILFLKSSITHLEIPGCDINILFGVTMVRACS